MRTLTFKERRFSVIKLSDKKEYKIPTEYLVEEAERLIELQIEQKKLESSEAIESIRELQVEGLYANIFSQLEIIFQHYQPEVTIDYLKKIVTHSEALEMLGFYNKYRKLILGGTDSANAEVKKKSKSVDSDLRELRRIITFMVMNGFSLFELRKLYLDELYFYHEEMFYVLEKMGKVKEGSYDNIIDSNHDENPEVIVNSLRKQLFKSIASKK